MPNGDFLGREICTRSVGAIDSPVPWPATLAAEPAAKQPFVVDSCKLSSLLKQSFPSGGFSVTDLICVLDLPLDPSRTFIDQHKTSWTRLHDGRIVKQPLFGQYKIFDKSNSWDYELIAHVRVKEMNHGGNGGTSSGLRVHV